ncbi:hypothetical protein HAX54_040206 [Datura stramonium]|uniref:Uncharacterized protein n=1 Tax=Datura stramonium TaxID=4076 RepID=A0ABS8SK69_DATST|nr:hypothetical protein [Datura stramonium]
MGNKDDENGYRLETKEEPAGIAGIMNAVKKVLTESKGTVRSLIALLGVSLVGMTEGIPFLISTAMAYWYPNFDVKMESVSTLCIESMSWLKEKNLNATQFFLTKDVTKIPPQGEVQDLDDKTKVSLFQANNNVNVVAFACKRTQVVELDENGLTFIDGGCPVRDHSFARVNLLVTFIEGWGFANYSAGHKKTKGYFYQTKKTTNYQGHVEKHTLSSLSDWNFVPSTQRKCNTGHHSKKLRDLTSL